MVGNQSAGAVNGRSVVEDDGGRADGIRVRCSEIRFVGQCGPESFQLQVGSVGSHGSIGGEVSECGGEIIGQIGGQFGSDFGKFLFQDQSLLRFIALATN